MSDDRLGTAIAEASSMQSQNVQGFGAMLARLAEPEVRPRAIPNSPTAQLQRLNAGFDTASAAAPTGTPMTQSRTASALADQLRLPPPPQPGRHIGRAAQRILDADTSAASADPAEILAEAKLRRVLSAVAHQVAFVQVETTKGKQG